MEVTKMNNKISLKLLTIFAFSGEIYGKNTPFEPIGSFLTPPTTDTVSSFMLTPMELIKPSSFDANIIIDFSIAMNIFWF
jgi:hypothetical protein